MMVRIDRCHPRVSITLQNACNEDIVQVLLYMRRTGEPQEFAVYEPIAIEYTKLTFEFDDLLFDKKEGQYTGRLVVNGQEYKCLHFIYRQGITIASIEKV